MTGTVSAIIVKSYLLQQDPVSCNHLKFAIVLTAFSCKLSSILDAGGNPDRPLITGFDKVIIHLAQATVVQFNLIAIYKGSCLYYSCKFILYQRLQDASFCLISSSLRQKLTAFGIKLLPKIAPSQILQASQIHF